jgi:hypothetical protein
LAFISHKLDQDVFHYQIKILKAAVFDIKEICSTVLSKVVQLADEQAEGL